MKKTKATYLELVKRLAVADPIVEALKHHEVDAVVGKEKIAFLLLRKVEESWLESNGEFSALFNLDGIGMIQADSPAFNFTRVNPKFCEMTAYSAEELLKKSYLGLTHPEDRRKGLKELARVIHGMSDSWSIEKRCVRKDGREIWVCVHGVALRDHAGRAIRIMAMFEDVTARKVAEQQQRDALEPLKQQLQERAAELLKILRSLRGRAGRRELADQVQRAIQKFVERCVDPLSDKSSAGRGKPKAAIKSPRKSAPRSPSRKRRPPSR